MELLLAEIIRLAEEKRPGFAHAIGYRGGASATEPREVPIAVHPLYAVARGTPRTISEQHLMDIVPGFRLIHLSEIEAVSRDLRRTWPELPAHVPFLADYGGCYYLVDSLSGAVLYLDPHDGVATVARSLNRFLQTVHRCYVEEAYFLDADGYLDYDETQVHRIGASMNPGCEHWAPDSDG